MGHHYVPQAHLRRFEIECHPGFVWMYDKQTRTFLEVPIKKVAQARKYYAPDVESGLADTIESPANAVIEKLRRREQLNNQERTRSITESR